MKKNVEETSDLIPGLPEEIALECLSRLHHTTHRVSARVCRRWRELLHSREFYNLRKQTGRTQKAACLVQSLPTQTGIETVKYAGSPGYCITLFDTETRTWHRVDPVPRYPDTLPLFCQITSSEGKLIVMGGWDPASYNPVRHVFVYNFTKQSWKQGRDMPENRSFFAVGSLNGRVIVAGGHDENKNALDSAWEYDADQDEWIQLARMSQGRDECEGVVIGSEFWVVSGYSTERQGFFVDSAEVYNIGSGKWRRVENAWKLGRSPRSCLGTTKDRQLFDWGEREDFPGRVKMCAIEFAERTILSAATHHVGEQMFFVVERHGIFDRIYAANEFAGFVQSGCCIEI